MIADTIALNIRLAWDNARRNLQCAQHKQKQNYDEHARPSSIETGSRVFIKDNTHRRNTSEKLNFRFKGRLYRCVRRDGNEIWVTPIDKPNAKPLRWHVEHAKLARLGNDDENIATHSTEMTRHSDQRRRAIKKNDNQSKLPNQSTRATSSFFENQSPTRMYYISAKATKSSIIR